MNLDDESFLSAYLDDELEPEHRLALEAELSADPLLADRLRALSATHDLLAGLSRPRLPFDLAGTICSRLEATTPCAGRVSANRLRWSRSPAFRGLAAAAAVLLALTIGLRLERQAAPSLPTGSPRDHLVKVAPPAPLPIAPAEVRPRETLASRPEIPSPAPIQRAGGVLAPEQVEAERRAEADRVKIRNLLDSPDLRRVFIVTDAMGGRVLDQVDELVQKSPRTEPTFGRITVSQGIFIDPAHPNEATVYALVMDDRELRQFHETLSEKFPGAVEETKPDPAQVTQLADLGQVSVQPGLAVADVFIPRDLPTRSAIREAARPRDPTTSVIEGGPDAPLEFRGPVVEDGRPEVVEREEPTPQQELSGPGGDRSGTKVAASPERGGTSLPGRRDVAANGPKARDEVEIEGIPNRGTVSLDLERAKAGRRNVVLVWVTAPGDSVAR